jgi:hypothetical protein
MKKSIITSGIILFFIGAIQAQNNVLPLSGNIGEGTLPSLTIPNYNLQLHGTTDYLYDNAVNPNPVASINLWNEPEKQNNYTTKAMVNAGKSVSFGMTNTTSGFGINDGTEFRMTQNNFSVINRENGNFTLGTKNAFMTFSNENSRVWIGGVSAPASPLYAKYNVVSNDNGIYIKSGSVDKYGLKVEVLAASNALEIYNTSSILKQFKVTGNGEVFARRYTTTLNNIPDYVFKEGYNLMSLNELKTFINTQQHLPNIPSEKEFQKDGVDIGELNRLLLEKVEELTLYILQLEERISKIEKQ